MEPRSVEGQFVDVIEGKVYPARVSFADGRVLAVERLEKAPEHHILPGFVEAHIHIESSQLCPSRFAEASVPHGTTSVINDPHEISNVLGMTGVRYMLEDAKGVPSRIYFTAPSCVPSTQHETSGAVLGKEEIDLLLRMKEFVALGEVMDFPAVLRDEVGIKEKIKVAREYWKPVDGHLSRHGRKRPGEVHQCRDILRSRVVDRGRGGGEVPPRHVDHGPGRVCQS